jgi:hypothetical protein
LAATNPHRTQWGWLLKGLMQPIDRPRVGDD